MTTATTVEVFAALGDSRRLQILELLHNWGQATAGDLAEPLKVTRQATLKHLVVLERTGFVGARRDGRKVLFAMRPEGFERSAEWLAQIPAGWDRRLQDIKEIAESS